MPEPVHYLQPWAQTPCGLCCYYDGKQPLLLGEAFYRVAVHPPGESPDWAVVTRDAAVVTCLECQEWLAQEAELGLIGGLGQACGGALDAMASTLRLQRHPGEPDSELRDRMVQVLLR